MWDKAKKAVQDAQEDMDHALSREIEYQEQQGYMRDSKDQPLAANKPEKEGK
jgi:hypothetical protein